MDLDFYRVPKKKYTLRNNDLQIKYFLDIRLKFLKLLQRKNPSFTLINNSAGLPMLTCADGVAHCTVYGKKQLDYFIRIACNEIINEYFISMPYKCIKKHTYNKCVYIYESHIVDLLLRYYSVEDFIEESASLSLVPDLCRIIYSYLSF